MTNYLDYQPKNTSRIRERIEWSTTYAYNATDKASPRALLIGDSICNGYQSEVRARLADSANVTFWASSKCVTDPDYFRELDFRQHRTILSAQMRSNFFVRHSKNSQAGYRPCQEFLM